MFFYVFLRTKWPIFFQNMSKTTKFEQNHVILCHFMSLISPVLYWRVCK